MDNSSWSALTELYVPELPWSFPLKCHPSYPNNRLALEEWTLNLSNNKSPARRQTIIDEKMAFGSCVTCALTLPDRMDKVAKFNMWYVHFDDVMDDLEGLGSDVGGTSALIDCYLGIMSSSQATGNAQLSEFTKLWLEMRSEMPPQQYDRFSSRVRGLFTANVSEVNWRSIGKVLELEELAVHRRHVSSVMSMLTLIEYGMGIELNEEAVRQGELETVERVIVDYICLVNDIFSLLVELAAGQASHNMIFVLCNSRGLSLEEGIATAVQKLGKLHRSFVELWESIRKSVYYDADVEAYLNALACFVAGAIEWHWQTGRYHGSDWVPHKDRRGTIYLPSKLRKVAPTK